jgi:hypothetical protein
MLDEAAAVRRLHAGQDVVVCGPNRVTNRLLAERIGMAAFGTCDHEDPHLSAGPRALPHFHPVAATARVHIFYELRPPKVTSRRGK